jgi:hypothetical protein
MDCEISERKQINHWHDKWIVKLVRENKPQLAWQVIVKLARKK